jgi:hypothetical protein
VSRVGAKECEMRFSMAYGDNSIDALGCRPPNETLSA